MVDNKKSQVHRRQFLKNSTAYSALLLLSLPHTAEAAGGIWSALNNESRYPGLKSDWTELPSVRNNKSEEWISNWETYRQALRDITSQETFPTSVTWPNKP